MGVYIKIPNVTFTKYIGIAEITDEPIVPDVPDVPVCEHVYDNEYDTTCNKCGAVREVDVPDTYPVTDTLKGLYYLGGTVDESLVDHSGNGNNATLVGSITTADGYATFTGTGTTNRMDTPIKTSVENKTTAVVMFRVPTGMRSIVSNYKGSNNYGFVFTNNRAYITADGNSGNKAFSATINSATNFAICAISIDVNSCRVVKDGNGTLVELMNFTDGGIYQWTQTFSIGGYRSNLSMNENADIALVSIHEGEVSDPQLQQIFEHVRWYGESKGLTIE